MFKLFRKANICAPEAKGERDILVCRQTVVHIAPEIPTPVGVGPVEEVNLEGHCIVPGLIDQHVHIIGGGGEGGPTTRTPEVMLSKITTAGTTTVVGVLGTDGTTRHMNSLLAKARALETEGVTTFIYTGAYELPTRTLTDNVRNDLVLIDKVIGTGEIAISDHRSAQPETWDIAKLAAEARVGGMLGGKPGVVHLHVGDGERGLKPIFEILENTELPISQFTPTHLNRTRRLLEQAIVFAKQGGMVDITAGPRAPEAIVHLLRSGVSVDRITISSDGNGSLPRFDEGHRLIGMGVGSLRTVYETIRSLILEHKIPKEQALRVATTNVASNLHLQGRKGVIAIGADADFLVLDDDFDIRQVWAKGRLMVQDGQPLVWGTFENAD